MFTFLICGLCLTLTEASKILVAVPTPSVSHQVVFYPLIKELLKKGHEIVFITTDPMYSKGQTPVNLTEIDTHDISYKVWREEIMTSEATHGTKDDQYGQITKMIRVIAKSFELQVLTQEVQELIKKRTHFDLIIVEGASKMAQSLSHIFKAPMIVMCSSGLLQDNFEVLGAPTNPKLLYGNLWQQKSNNLTIYDKVKLLWDNFKLNRFFTTFMVEENKTIKRLFGPDTPSLEELGSNVHMVFWNLYAIWEKNRPIPPNGVLIAGIHIKPENELPKDLKTYLDSSKRGVIYVSFGTNVSPSSLDPRKSQIIINAISRLPYDVLLKWDKDVIPDKGSNIKAAKWYPQSDVLRHPNVKAFVTQGGLQSFDEALTGGVPLVGIPMLGDQWYNVERIHALEIGVGLLMEELTEDKLVDAVNTVAKDPKYKRNISDLRDKLRDQPLSGLELAVWWTEYVLRHKGAAHLKPPTANMSWAEYLDIELLTVVAIATLIVLTLAVLTLYMFVRFLLNVFVSAEKTKTL